MNVVWSERGRFLPAPAGPSPSAATKHQQHQQNDQKCAVHTCLTSEGQRKAPAVRRASTNTTAAERRCWASYAQHSRSTVIEVYGNPVAAESTAGAIFHSLAGITRSLAASSATGRERSA